MNIPAQWRGAWLVFGLLFSTTAALAQPTVSIQVIPVDVLYLSDFDPIDPAGSALLYTVTVVNDATPRDARVLIRVSSRKYGRLGYGEESLRTLAPDAVITFTNRDLDEVNLDEASDDLIRIATESGLLPPDEYTFNVTLESVDGDLLAETDGSSLTTNPGSQLELIAPGNPFDDAAATAGSAFPYFQWFGGARSYELAVYAVPDGRPSAEETVEQLPVYRSARLTETSLIYPSFAEQLEPGARYAWQVTAIVNGQGGELLQRSPVYWFSVPSDGTTSSGSLSEAEVIPAQVSVKVGGTIQFSAQAFDADGLPVTTAPTWSVVPAGFAEIDASGLLVAGTRPATIAVIADYGSTQSYAQLTISWSSGALWMRQLMQELFGLPTEAK